MDISYGRFVTKNSLQNTASQKLVDAIQSGIIPEDVCNIFLSLTNEYLTKGDLMDIVYDENSRRKVDSAYPQPYADQLRQLNPQFRGHFMVFDYNENKFGVFENLAERVIMLIAKKMKEHVPVDDTDYDNLSQTMSDAMWEGDATR